MCLQVADIRGKEAAAAETPAAGDAPQLDFAQPEPENVDEVCAVQIWKLMSLLQLIFLASHQA
jgi:hypothetical protein